MTGDAVSRIDNRFADLKAKGRAGLVTFITAGDPDHETCARLLAQLPVAGADVIELGMPFSDPMADGPSIEAAGLRALANGASMKTTLVRETARFRLFTVLIIIRSSRKFSNCFPKLLYIPFLYR